MKKLNSYVPTREPLEVIQADPKQGLTEEQVQFRAACGWRNLDTTGHGKTEKDIILGHTLTFFNLVFVVLAAVLVFVGSSPRNMTFLMRSIALGREKYGLPEREKGKFTNFIR